MSISLAPGIGHTAINTASSWVYLEFSVPPSSSIFTKATSPSRITSSFDSRKIRFLKSSSSKRAGLASISIRCTLFSVLPRVAITLLFEIAERMSDVLISSAVINSGFNQILIAGDLPPIISAFLTPAIEPKLGKISLSRKSVVADLDIPFFKTTGR